MILKNPPWEFSPPKVLSANKVRSPSPKTPSRNAAATRQDAQTEGLQVKVHTFSELQQVSDSCQGRLVSSRGDVFSESLIRLCLFSQPSQQASQNRDVGSDPSRAHQSLGRQVWQTARKDEYNLYKRRREKKWSPRGAIKLSFSGYRQSIVRREKKKSAGLFRGRCCALLCSGQLLETGKVLGGRWTGRDVGGGICSFFFFFFPLVFK